VVRQVLNSLLYFPSKAILETPADAGLDFHDLAIETADGERLHGWWVAARSTPAAHVLLCHGNAGNVGDRVLHAQLLCEAGLDVLLFDYRGYGRSTGRPGEQGLYRDARAAREALLREPGVDPGRLVYVGESLGGAVALELALEHPPAGLVLQSTFTGVREMAALHYPFVPARLVPEAYPSLARIPALRAPLLVLHGDRDDIVPVDQGRALFEAAPEPKEIRLFPGLGHNDLVPLAGRAYGEAIADFARKFTRSPEANSSAKRSRL
jgi:uncharacterized protein